MKFAKESLDGCLSKGVDHSPLTLGMGGENPPPAKRFATSSSLTTLKANSRGVGAQTLLPRKVAILDLKLKKKWFDLIKSGKKPFEFRAYKKYWIKRLVLKDGSFKPYTHIKFSNGYGKLVPSFVIEIKEISRKFHLCHGDVFAFKLGSIRVEAQTLLPREVAPRGENTLESFKTSKTKKPFLRVKGRSPLSPKMVTPRSPLILNNTANLDDPDPVSPYPVRLRTCTLTYIVKECGCGRSLYPSTCMSLICKNCAPWVTKRRAFAIFNRFIPEDQVKSKNIIYTVLTVPKELRKNFVDSKSWQKVRKKAWKILVNRFGAKYGVECSHPNSEKDPIFHPHMNFLWVQRKGFDPYLNVSMLRKEWAALLGAENAIVHSQYTSSRARIMHWCKYVARVFPGFHKWTGPVRWFGKYPRASKPEPCSCWLCGQDFKTVGFIHYIDVDDYYSAGWKYGVDPPWYDDSKIVHVRKKKVVD